MDRSPSLTRARLKGVLGLQGTIYLGAERICQIPSGTSGIRRRALGHESVPLRLRERFAACVGKQPVEYAGEVLQVKPAEATPPGLHRIA
jgi:hypothetical protein